MAASNPASQRRKRSREPMHVDLLGTRTRLDPGRNMGKTNPLNDADLADFIGRQASFAEGPNSWSVAVDTLNPANFDLTVRNPNAPEAEALRSPQEILDEIAALDAESAEILARVRELL